MKAREIIEVLEEIAPTKLIDSWDNTGFQIGNDEKEIRSILIALDLDEKIVDKAIEEEFQMIVTHHPLIFKPLKNINNSNYIGNLIMKIIANDIVVYNAHTNLDLAYGGINDELARLLNLKNVEPLSEVTIDGEQYGYGRVGDIEQTDFDNFINKIKSTLSVDDIRVYGEEISKIKKVALCGGSGSGFIQDAHRKNADIYITGDIKYHDAQLGLQLGLILIDAGHFHTEKIILPKLKEIILEKTQDKIEIEVDMNTSVTYKIY